MFHKFKEWDYPMLNVGGNLIHAADVIRVSAEPYNDDNHVYLQYREGEMTVAFDAEKEARAFIKDTTKHMIKARRKLL